MLTQYIPHPTAPCVQLHNTAQWQVAEHLGGLGYELLRKERDVCREDQADLGLTLHACYPSVFFQGDAALEFADELEQAQSKLTPAEVDKLFLSNYKVLF